MGLRDTKTIKDKKLPHRTLKFRFQLIEFVKKCMQKLTVVLKKGEVEWIFRLRV